MGTNVWARLQSAFAHTLVPKMPRIYFAALV
ncbi:protein of unknown function [Burkholderia multivorans]